MRVYLDVCCLNRPFDNLVQERIQFESDAVLAILARCQVSNWTLLSSEIIDLEISKTKNIDKREKALSLLSISTEKLAFSEAARLQSIAFQKNGIKPMDSLHLAIADDSKVDVLLTTDDDFLKAAKKMRLSIRVENPTTWYMEVMQNER